ncbi:LysM peptidoglycan-binding domain-containing protein [Psychrobacter sp. I-STPA6b]|uniref:LysM peptidoglycan-binding domain-containing protein n=1 Tax=Psychrobacter sp. I-STPA6b TaxID=2585718 RepID=UPI001D0C4B11|nr:LysM peptidoglycan-binding domain-containing protein [Psychrobacter sp. I-STPA6b]
MSQKVPTTYSFIKLPLCLAVTSLLLTACSNTPTVQRAPTATQVPVSSSQQSTRQPASAPDVTYQAPTQQPAIAPTSAYSTALLDEDSLDELESLLEATDMSMVEDNKLVIQRVGDLWDRVRGGFRLNQDQYTSNPRIEAQRGWFISRQDYLNRLTARASRYLYHTVREAERRNIPTELALLPVIESSYDPTATSNAAAAGLWQFIPSTGRIYGLAQSSSYDGRRDVVESTRAAYDFLTALHNQFGSWELALAAYNAGPARIERAIKANEERGLPTDFWSLNLPTETRNYVPRFLAVAQVVQNPSRYGVSLPPIANRAHFRSVPTNYGVSLADVSRITGVSYDELTKLNPALKTGRIDASGANRVIIPNEVNFSIDDKISALSADSGRNVTIDEAIISETYDPNRPALSGSSSELAEFAQNARVLNQSSSQPLSPAQEQIKTQKAEQSIVASTSATVTPNRTIIQEPPLSQAEKDFISAQIQQQTPQVAEVVNPSDGNIKLSAVQTQQSILEAQGKEKKLEYESSTVATSSTRPRPQGTRTTYRVVPGDTLSNIASRANVTVQDIAEWNQIKPNGTLMAGSTLYLYNARPIAPLSSDTGRTSTASSARPTSYVVQRGDTLIETATRFGLSTSELASYNNLPTNAQLRYGEKLWLIPGQVEPVAAPKETASSSSSVINNSYTGRTTNYKVRPGDNLTVLAGQYGISVSTLAGMNGLSSSAGLYTGQVLTVPAGTRTSAPTSSGSASAASTSKYTGPVSTYRVKSGDTLIGIANDLGVSREDIASLNSFGANAQLLRGSNIKVPASRETVDLNLNNQSVSYKVASGDTLIGVARRFNVSVSDLAAANNLSTNAQLILGRTITIPAKGQVSSASQDGGRASSATTSRDTAQLLSNTTNYKVKSGDTLIGLANQYGVSVSDLAKTNDLATNAQLQIGQTLKVPEQARQSSSASSSTSSASTSNSMNTFKSTEEYTVTAGDTLIGLARRYGVSATELASANGLSSSAMLQRGQRLKVPKLTVSYKVKSGDSLIGLAGRYGIAVSELAKMNDLADNAQLKIGQILTVPNR